MAGLLEYTKNGQVTEPPLYRFMKGNVQSFLNSIPDPSKMTPEQQLSLGANVNPIMGLLGMTAYHGSPFLFDKFDIKKVGAGEGAQAYGHGMYFAENPNVAKSYARMLAGPEQTAAEYLKMYKTPESAISVLESDIKPNLTSEAKEFTQKAIDTLKSGKKLTGNMYRVDIPDEYIPKMLDWDKPFKEQNLSLFDYVDYIPPSQRDTLSKVTSDLKNSDVSVSSFYDTLSEALGSPQKASEALQKAGIPGIKYLDQDSRVAGGTRNYVVFDPDKVKILEKGLLSK
jgi:hypothetical protein